MGKPDLSAVCEKKVWSLIIGNQECACYQPCSCRPVPGSYTCMVQDKESWVSLQATLVILNLAYYIHVWTPHFKRQVLECRQRINDKIKHLELNILTSAIAIANSFYKGRCSFGEKLFKVIQPVTDNVEFKFVLIWSMLYCIMCIFLLATPGVALLLGWNLPFFTE